MKLALYKTILQPYYQGTYYLGFALIKAFLAHHRPSIETVICHSPEQVLLEKPECYWFVFRNGTHGRSPLTSRVSSRRNLEFPL